MAGNSDSEVYLSISIDRDGKFVMSQKGKHVVQEYLKTPPDPQTLERVTTIEIYRRKTEDPKEPKKKPPCLEFINPPGVWVCACDDPRDC